ncbi:MULTISPECIES: DUF1846 domain-containing protein [unclassified Bifidobacterium]|uniref:DUF1846 domain-containing protein n=1 Tax=unclassified Bifidobacterium TaxID=2608897 RepID=UPI0011263D91|nr:MULTISPECIES: DUF1846 domain-containing protein [unclassified Bifidobacterium]TPF77484.1 hypothetical protein BW09_09530 [Bifidobacterium sp. UTCIF-1]TPF79281.1 hypothetical protein BW08_10920 [Bifidobacterium sp. UTCIF-24]TPF83099.1 hypothetical protein BW12_01135 [Bifidobacterium sp. UTCIF-3]TPF84927.1 hypothetical protein BW07_01215 [Bifidobacterium sp. UTCIF-36]TPF89200.1 hypothetical protein BW10_07520 [Bifidobacterium sp. UTBIF-56]
MHQGFDNEKYIALQADNIKKRIAQFGGKLYLEFGGKLFDDYHASRVLPGFEPDVKFRMLQSLTDEVEIVIAVNANHIEKAKMRGDLGITYDEDVLRLIDVFRSHGMLVGSVVLTQYAGQPAADAYRHRLAQLGVTCYLHYPIAGYPHDIEHIVSAEGYGKNDYVETSRPLVVVTAPGPGSGKLATCLSQLYHEHQRGIDAGYAKYETFPVWNLPLNHPVNIAYEAATVDLDDANIIDPFHLEAHGETTVNYNRDVEAFPVLKAMMERIMGESPYQSPTDMGVNMVGYAIVDDDVCREAARMEIVRRFFDAAVRFKRTGAGEEQVERLRSIMNKAGVTPDLSPARKVALAKESDTGAPAGAMVLPDGRVVTGKTGELLGAASALLMNALKAITGVDDDVLVIDDAAIEPICRLKTEHLHSTNRRLHSDETLIALSITSATSTVGAQVIAGLEQLRGCDAFFSVIISAADEALYRKLGINVCCEPKYERVSLYHK